MEMKKYLVSLEWDEGEPLVEDIIVESNLSHEELTKYLYRKDTTGHLVSLEVKATETGDPPAFIVEKKPVMTPLDHIIEDIEEGKI